jgi:hypothetical protein
MKLRTASALLLAILMLAGCQNAGEGSNTAGGPGVTATGDSAPKEPAWTSEVPEELKHDAYRYYGLTNPEPIYMEAVYPEGPTRSGTQVTKFVEMKDGHAVFTIERTDDLAALGNQTVSVEKDGIYVTQADVAKVDHDLEMPSDLSAGKTWKNHLESTGGQDFVVDSTFKVEGPEKVTTGVGEREALLITSTGTGTLAGKKVTMSSRNWYTKDVGQVKAEITIVDADGNKQTVTIQEVAKPKEEATGAEGTATQDKE